MSKMLQTQNDLTVVVCPHPFATTKQIYTFQATLSLAQILQKVHCTKTRTLRYAICVNGNLIPSEWETIYPPPNSLVTIRCVPQGNIGKIFLTILAVVAVVAAIVSGYGALVFTQAAIAKGATVLGVKIATWAAVAKIAGALVIGVGLAMALSQSQPKLPGVDQPGQISSITGSRNRILPHGTIPRILGKHKIFPPFASLPYTEFIENDQYLICLFCLGYGPLTITDLKIGETELSNYQEVQYNIHHTHTGKTYPLEIYTQDVYEDTINVELPNQENDDGTSNYIIRTTTPDTVKISVDMVYPQGLIQISQSGERLSWPAGPIIWYREVGKGTWILLSPAHATQSTTQKRTDDPETITRYEYTEESGYEEERTIIEDNPRGKARHFELIDKTTTPQRQNISWKVVKGQYEVAIARTKNKRTEEDREKYKDQVYERVDWTILRSFKATPPVETTKDLVLLEMRIRATEQLSGYLEEFNCIATSHLQVYDGSSWSLQPTQNAAWCYTSVLLDAANSQAIQPSRLDVQAFKNWADWCETHNFHYNRVVDSSTTVFDLLREIAAAGKALFHINDGQYSIIREVAQTTPVQIFTPRNTISYSGDKIFIEQPPQAYKMPFVNEELNYEEDEYIVYNDGYNESNTTIFETLNTKGITHWRQLQRIGRYLLGEQQLRPEIHTITTDFEHLVCTRGDLVEFNQSAINLGVGSARIKSVTMSGTTSMTGLVLDTKIPLADNTQYGIYVRHGDGDRHSYDVTVPSTVHETDTLTFETPLIVDPALAGHLYPEVGDLVAIGTRQSVAERFIVKSIEHQSDLQAQLTLVAEAPVLQQVDIEAIPDWDPRITNLSLRERLRPPVPTIIDVHSDESVLLRDADGSLTIRMVVYVSMPVFKTTEQVFYELRYKLYGPREKWLILPIVSIETEEISITDVQERSTYEISIRAITSTGLHSRWSPAILHNVVGKLTPPPNVENFLVSRQADGTRIFEWELNSPPTDLAGYKIKYKQQSNASRVMSYQYRQKLSTTTTWGAWTDISQSSPGQIQAGQFTITGLTAGTYNFQVRTVLLDGEFSDPSPTQTVTVS